MQKIAMIKDNFSMAILHYKIISTNISSSFIRDLLEETFDKYELFQRTNDIQIISNGGSEKDKIK
jgi:hypothetical protein